MGIQVKLGSFELFSRVAYGFLRALEAPYILQKCYVDAICQMVSGYVIPIYLILSFVLKLVWPRSNGNYRDILVIVSFGMDFSLFNT